MIQTLFLFLATFSYIRFTIAFSINIWYETSDSHSFLGLLLMFLVQLHVQIPESEKYYYLRLLILFDNQICFLIQISLTAILIYHLEKSHHFSAAVSPSSSNFYLTRFISISIHVSGSRTVPYFRLPVGNFFEIPIIFSVSIFFPVFFSFFVKFMFQFVFQFNRHIKNSVS